ncbi:hypothetical protein A9Q99_16325 [Gammaproteobacteria bacterium 45_16_T64]|nr:hypothetical protein A9Q99_16325 [Gammaproteobacteria bacterium 45_16_T64]
MVTQADKLRLKIPPQDLSMLSFCTPQPKRLQEWVDALPQMNVGECAKQLYAAIQEVNRYKTDTHLRLQLLEILREPIRYICESLGKHFLNKPVILPAKESKIANLAQALQNHLATGYKTIVVQSMPRLKANDRDAKKDATMAIHRALSEQGHVLLRSYQLYYPAPPNFWKEAHLLYLIAEQYKLLDVQVKSPNGENSSSSISDIYLRLLLLSTCKPNQLRQQQIQHVFKATANWTPYASIEDSVEATSLYTISLLSDSPPIYNALMNTLSEPTDHTHMRYLNAADLSDHLRVQLQLPSDQSHPIPDFLVPKAIANDLIRQLIQAWGVLTERAFTRLEEAGQLTLCLGLSATHYFVSDKADFSSMMSDNNHDTILNATESNPFLNTGPTNRRENLDNGDVWAHHLDSDTSHLNSGGIDFDIANFQEENAPQKPDKYPSYKCTVVNTSPGGFCLSWSQDVPPQVKTGEIVGIQEASKRHWSIGVIRWVKQFKKDGARMGIELLAPKADSCGTQVLHKKGDVSEYLRTLELPELKAIGQPATLITPNIAFHVGYKVNINKGGDVGKAQLIKQVASTASFSQFQYKWMTSAPKKASTPAPSEEIKSTPKDDDFDSIWSSL